jgi:N-dimethylarginine dimethylaminohydrolase
MKISFEEQGSAALSARVANAEVRGETDALSDVLLCTPTYLEPVPCCSVTRERLRQGFTTSTSRALDQHRAVIETLERQGVTCHRLPAHPSMADLCFTRDIAASTPWGLVALSPASPHRAQESAYLASNAGQLVSNPVARIVDGTIEGGDICIGRTYKCDWCSGVLRPLCSRGLGCPKLPL